MKLRKPTLRGLPKRHPDSPAPGVCAMPTTDNQPACPYCNAPGHNESSQTCPQRAQDAIRFARSGKEAYPVAESPFLKQFRAGLDARLAALKPGEMQAMYEAAGVEFEERKWCAMCGKWGDHTSGGCPVFAQMPKDAPKGWEVKP